MSETRLKHLNTEQIVEIHGEEMLVEAGYREGEPFWIHSEGAPVAAFIEAFADYLNVPGAENYIEMHLTHEDHGEFTVLVQRANGLTPAVKCQQVEAERDRLQSIVAALVAHPAFGDDAP